MYHDSFIRVTRLIRTCDLTYLYEWHDSSIHVTRLIHMFDMLYAYVCGQGEYYQTCDLPTHVRLTYTLAHEASRSYEWGISRIWMSHMENMDESCNTCQWVVGHVFMSFVTHVNESRYIYNPWPHSYSWHAAFTFDIWLLHMCDMSHSYVRYESFNCVAWIIYMHYLTHSYVWPDCLDPFVCVTWLIHMYDTTHSYVWHALYHAYVCRCCDESRYTYNLIICLTLLIHIRATGVVCVPWLVPYITHMCVGAASTARRAPGVVYVPWLIHLCHTTHAYATRPMHLCDMSDCVHV